MDFQFEKKPEYNFIKDLKKVGIGLGWDANPDYSGHKFDLDLSILMLGAKEKLFREDYFVYWGRRIPKDGSVIHHGDKTSGEETGDDEKIEIDLTKVNLDTREIMVVVNIYDAETRNQTFKLINNCYVRIFKWDNPDENITNTYKLQNDFGDDHIFVMGNFYKDDNQEWGFSEKPTGYQCKFKDFINLFT